MILRLSFIFIFSLIHAANASPKLPQRIITLAPSLGEIVAELLPENEHPRLVAVSEFTDYPDWASKLPKIGPFSKVNIEKIAALKPDLVIGTKDGNSKDQLSHLNELGIKSIVVDTQRLDDAMISWRSIADAIGHGDAASKWISSFSHFLAQIKNKNPDLLKKRVAIQVSIEPIVMAGDLSFVHDLISKLGVSNIYAGTQMTYLKPSLEDVTERKPDLIIYLAMKAGTDAEREKIKKQWAHLKNTRIVTSSHSGLLRPTPRMQEGLVELATLIKSHEAL